MAYIHQIGTNTWVSNAVEPLDQFPAIVLYPNLFEIVQGDPTADMDQLIFEAS